MKKLTLTLAALVSRQLGGSHAEPSFSITGMLRQEVANNRGANKHTHWGSPFNGKQTNTTYLNALAH